MSEDPIKTALQRIPYGFYSLTSRNGDDVNGMVVNWLTQVSFSPRLVAIGLAKNSYSYGLVRAGDVFAINLFNKADQEALMPLTKSRARRPDKMDGVSYTEGPETGCPILSEAAAYIECNVREMVDVGGDHVILVGEAVAAAIMKDGEVTDTLTLPDVGWSYSG